MTGRIPNYPYATVRWSGRNYMFCLFDREGNLARTLYVGRDAFDRVVKDLARIGYPTYEI